MGQIYTRRQFSLPQTLWPRRWPQPINCSSCGSIGCSRHRTGFRLYWRWKSRSRGGRPKDAVEVRRLIWEMLANGFGGTPRIHGELLKLGIEVAQSTVAHGEEWASAVAVLEGFPSQSCSWHRWHGLPGRADGRLQAIVHPGCSEASALAAADITHGDDQSNGGMDRPPDHRCFPWNEAPDYLIRDRDGSYGHAVARRLSAMTAIWQPPIRPPRKPKEKK